MKPLISKSSPVRWVPSAYFAMGLPFVVLNMVSVLMFKGMGIEDAKITLWTSVIMFPWTIKFLWSPLLERYRTKKFHVTLTQILTGVMFGLVAAALHLPHFFCVCIALLAVAALSGATHDIALDGLYMSELSQKDQAKYIGWQGAFYNLAKLFATGVLVYLAGVLMDGFRSRTPMASDTDVAAFGWGVIMLSASVVMILLGLYHIRALPCSRESDSKRSSNGFSETLSVIGDFFRKKHIWTYIAFIILYRLGEGFVMKIVPLFLKADCASGGLGLTEQQIGMYYGAFGAAAFVAGSLLAGYYISRKGLRKTLFWLCCIFNIPFLVYAFLAIFQPQQMWLIASGIIFEYFGYGFGFVGLTLFMMQQVAPGKHQMAHYAFASGIMNLSVMVTGAVSGTLSDLLGYKVFFIAVMFATIPAFIITRRVPFVHE